MKPIQLLLLDDSEEFYALLRSQLTDTYTSYNIEHTKTVEQTLEALTFKPYDLVLVDHLLLGGETGFNLLQDPIFKAYKIPAIFIASQGDEYVAVKAMKAGALDYLVKDRFDSSRLIYAINDALKTHKYNTKLEAHQIELIKLATTDELTGLYNRRHFINCLQAELARYTRYSTPISIAIIDIDHFKTINDNNGHDAGDYVLREIGKLIRTTIRSTDSASRYGGEEFVIIFPMTPLLGAELFAERLREKIALYSLHYDHMHMNVTVSIGLAEAYSEIKSADMLLKLADKALYAAKKDGRNKVISYRYGSGL